jgi:hypothetical protein
LTDAQTPSGFCRSEIYRFFRFYFNAIIDQAALNHIRNIFPFLNFTFNSGLFGSYFSKQILILMDNKAYLWAERGLNSRYYHINPF